MQLTVFYDGTCPLCVAEMNMLRDLDKRSALCLEDIYGVGFKERYPSIDVEAANRIIQGIDAKGQMLYGLDVIANAWSLVGKKRWISILRWPVIRWFSDKAYLIFANNRQSFSRVIMGRERCDANGQCQISSPSVKPNTKPNCLRSPNEDAEF